MIHFPPLPAATFANKSCDLLRQLLLIKHTELTILADQITRDGRIMIEDFPVFKAPMPYENLLALIDGDGYFSPDGSALAKRLIVQILRYQRTVLRWKSYHSAIKPFVKLAIFIRGTKVFQVEKNPASNGK